MLLTLLTRISVDVIWATAVVPEGAAPTVQAPDVVEEPPPSIEGISDRHPPEGGASKVAPELCGDSALVLAVLRELARRAWERQELADSANVTADRHRLAPLPVQHVLLLDRRAEDLRREFLATLSSVRDFGRDCLSEPSLVLREVFGVPCDHLTGLTRYLDGMSAERHGWAVAGLRSPGAPCRQIESQEDECRG